MFDRTVQDDRGWDRLKIRLGILVLARRKTACFLEAVTRNCEATFDSRFVERIAVYEFE